MVESSGGAVVRFAMSCAGCGSAGVCATARRRVEVPVRWLGFDRAPAPGDTVSVTVSAAALTRIALALFAAPLAVLLAGAWLGEHLAGAFAWPPGIAPALGFAGFALALLIPLWRGRQLAAALAVHSEVTLEVPLRVDQDVHHHESQRSR